MVYFLRQNLVGIILGLGILIFPGLSFAGKTLWKQANNPANYVMLENIKEAKAEDLVLNHPYSFDPKKLTDMLLSLRYNKALLLRKDIQDRQIFFDVETLEKKFAPRIVEAFQQASPHEVVIFSIVQKDPYFIIRNDRLSIVRAFVAQDGLHLAFLKTDAKLMGDYQAKSVGRTLIESSKGLGITFEPQEGQKLSFVDPKEIILDLNYDFAALVDKKAAEEEMKEAEKKKRSKPTPRSDSAQAGVSEGSSTPSSSTTSKTPEQRLTELKQLKEKGFITPQEYEAKRKEILKDL